MHSQLFRTEDLKLNKYRFIDTQVLEEMDLPLFLLPVKYDDALYALKEAESCYRKWFSARDDNGNVSDLYSRDDTKYYLRWSETTEQPFVSLISGPAKPLISPAFIFNN